MKSISELSSIYDAEEEQLLREYFEFLKIPSISSEPEYKSQVLKCATWVKELLTAAGFSVELWTGPGHPTVYAELISNPSYPTLMFYNHYDVQPVDPLEEWKSPPFEPNIVDGQVYARGAQDNKGQCLYTLAAIRSFVKRNQNRKINLKLIVEGEEETGSTVLFGIIPEKRESLKADALVVPDVGIKSLDAPSITLGTRGIVTMTITLTGSNTDLHSGMVGGIVYNPNRALAELLSSLYDERGKVDIPGFYEDVVEISAAEMESYDLTFDEDRFNHVFSTKPTGGEDGLLPTVRAWLRPTVEINGVAGGYYGSGFKTVIPAQSIVKLSCRLVPDQSPEKIGELVKKYFQDRCPDGVDIKVQLHGGPGQPLRTSPDSKIVHVAAAAISETFAGKPCGKILTGGSIPVISELSAASGAETVFLGYGLDTDQIHAPNEHFGLDRLKLGYITISKLLELYR